MNIIAAVDKNWAIGKNNELTGTDSDGSEIFPGDDNRESCRDGTKDAGEFSKWSSAEKPHQYRADT